MTRDEIRKALKAQPFQPFTMILADGREILAHHPEYMIVPPVGRTACVWQKNGELDIIDIIMVTDLKFGPPAEAPAQAT